MENQRRERNGKETTKADRREKRTLKVKNSRKIAPTGNISVLNYLHESLPQPPSNLCMNVTFSVKPARTRLFKIAVFALCPSLAFLVTLTLLISFFP